MVNLVKKFEDNAPKLVSLAKKAQVSLSKFKLDDIEAEVCLVLDCSGSIVKQYMYGDMQKTINKLFPLAVHFDDNNQLDTWTFSNKSKKLSNISFSNLDNFLTKEWNGYTHWMQQLDSSVNNEPAVISDVINHFFDITIPFKEKTSFWNTLKDIFNPSTNNSSFEFAKIQHPRKPILVLFISDGGVGFNEDIEFLLKWSSSLPIFWQFVGIGGSNYGALENFDTMEGRFIDNANFFSIDNIDSITEEELYDNLIQEFPSWIKLSKQKNLIV